MTKKNFEKHIFLFSLLFLFGMINTVNAATFTVTNTNDSGAGSLRDAITQANTNAQADTINFDPAVFNVAQTITLTSGEIQIGPDGTNPGRLVVINGPGANLLTISGGNASRIFLLGPQFNANVTMNGMTLRDGNGISSVSNGNGGAIYAQVVANLTLNSMVIRNNVVTAVASGGGIYVNSSATTVINDSLITENSAYNLGGIFVDSNTFTMRNTIVSNNRAIPGDVGGIGTNLGTVDIKNCQITGNKADRDIGGMNANSGTINITDTLISGNDSAGGSGGGLRLNQPRVANLRRVTISNNVGSGLDIDRISEAVNIIDSTISNNHVRDFDGFVGEAGGGINIANESNSPTRIINTTISGNSAPDSGGGIHNFSPGLEIINSTIVNNFTTKSDGRFGGGGIYDGELARSGGGSFGFRFKIQNSIVANNTSGSVGPDIRSGFDSAGYNIIGNTSGVNNSTANTGDQFNVNPNVGALADNGGPTRTHALLAGSPAINAGSNALAVDQNGNPLQFDQRGSCYKRIVGGTVDIGAYEKDATGQCGSTKFDFDGDGKADISTFRNSNRTWYINQSTGGFTGVQFGLASDKLAPADYDGDGKSDVAVFRESEGNFYILNSSDGSVRIENFGLAGDKLTVGDWDGDGKADLSVWREGSQGVFYYRGSSNNPSGGITFVPFGTTGDKPLRGDFDGDGKQDAAVFRPSNGVWYIRQSSDNQIRYVQFGLGSDTLVPADYDGDGKTDIAVFRNGVWYILQSANNQVRYETFGLASDKLVPADYDGDGKVDVAVFRNGVWYILQSSNGSVSYINFGLSDDRPIPNAYITQ